MTTREELKGLYQEMADFTRPLCASCNVPLSCCSPEYCQMAKAIAEQHWGETLQVTDHKTLPLMGPSGCIAAPHDRPLCSIHVCEGTLMRQLPEVQQRYWELREALDEAEGEIGGLEDIVLPLLLD